MRQEIILLSKITFNSDIEWTDKTRKSLLKTSIRKVKKEGKEKLLQGIQLAKELQAWAGAKNTADTAVTVSAKQNTI